MFTFGIILALPGTVLGLDDAVVQFGLTLTDRGTLISAMFVGLLIGSAVSAPVVDSFGQRASLAGSAMLVGLCLPLFAFADSFALALASIVAVGFASAGMNTAANALSSDLFPHERGRRMNGLALMVGLGGLSLPALAAVTAGVISWRGIVLTGASVSGLVAVAAMLVRVPPLPARPPAGAALATVVRQPGFGWFVLLLLLGPATEASMAGWTSTYLGTMGFNQSAATWALSSHWLGLVAGRLMFSGYVDREKAVAIVRAALGGAMLIAVFAAAPWPWLLAAAPFAIGVAIAVVVPTSLALAGERYPGHPGTLFGVLLTFAQVGAMIMPAAIGVVASRYGLRGGLLLLIVGGVATAAVTRRARGAPPGTT
jgi:DHA1 family bicyclomycin/chloramphenicol resistance-like MFS transporter